MFTVHDLDTKRTTIFISSWFHVHSILCEQVDMFLPSFSHKEELVRAIHLLHVHVCTCITLHGVEGYAGMWYMYNLDAINTNINEY